MFTETVRSIVCCYGVILRYSFPECLYSVHVYDLQFESRQKMNGGLTTQAAEMGGQAGA